MDYGQQLVYLMDAAFAADAEKQEDGLRTHLGASVIGKKCLREIWYGWKWVDRPLFEGRMLRLFSRGHKQETIFADLLRMLGAKVWTEDKDGKQFRVSQFGGHYGGSCDGVAQDLPGMPGVPVLLEFKTHNDKSFKLLLSKGLEATKPRHKKQAQVYMQKLGLTMCLYCAANKNDDNLWLYLFPFDPVEATMLDNRAETVIFGNGIPGRISQQSSWHECRFCDFRDVCHFKKEPLRNCRTCAHSQACRDGTWLCKANRPEIQTQPKEGCHLYQITPDLC